MFFIIESIIYWLIDVGFSGLVDQLEDRLLCKQEVARSNRAQSTIFPCLLLIPFSVSIRSIPSGFRLHPGSTIVFGTRIHLDSCMFVENQSILRWNCES